MRETLHLTGDAATYRRLLGLWVCCVVAATVVSMRTIGNSSACLTPDEAFSWRVTQRPWAQMLDCVARDTHPPGYFLLLKGWVIVWGDSPSALRSMSVLFGLLAVGVTFLAVRTWTMTGSGAAKVHSWRCAGPALVVTLAAAGSQQVEAAFTARMYSQGAFCCALTQLFLARALLAEASRGRALFGYALAVAGFLYTHHYALFTVAAQASLVLALCAQCRIRRQRGAGRILASYALALLAAFALYSPWAPVLVEQIRRVDAGFCESGATIADVSRSFALWCIGFNSAQTVWVWCWVAFAAVGIIAAFRAAPFGASFFCWQAVIPWVLCLRPWAIGAPVILADRYFTFAQLSLFCLWGIALQSIKEPVRRACYATAILAFVGWGTAAAISARLAQPSPLIAAAAQMCGELRRADLVVVSGPGDVNLHRYYCRRMGRADIRFRCKLEFAHVRGLVAHAASLVDVDVLRRDDVFPDGGRLWVCAREDSAFALVPPNARIIGRRVFGGRRGPRWALLHCAVGERDERVIEHALQAGGSGA